MVEFIIGLVIGAIVGVASMVGAMRRASSKPFGRTAKTLALLAPTKGSGGDA